MADETKKPKKYSPTKVERGYLKGLMAAQKRSVRRVIRGAEDVVAAVRARLSIPEDVRLTLGPDFQVVEVEDEKKADEKKADEKKADAPAASTPPPAPPVVPPETTKADAPSPKVIDMPKLVEEKPAAPAATGT